MMMSLGAAIARMEPIQPWSVLRHLFIINGDNAVVDLNVALRL